MMRVTHPSSDARAPLPARPKIVRNKPMPSTDRFTARRINGSATSSSSSSTTGMLNRATSRPREPHRRPLGANLWSAEHLNRLEARLPHFASTGRAVASHSTNAFNPAVSVQEDYLATPHSFVMPEEDDLVMTYTSVAAVTEDPLVGSHRVIMPEHDTGTRHDDFAPMDMDGGDAQHVGGMAGVRHTGDISAAPSSSAHTYVPVLPTPDDDELVVSVWVPPVSSRSTSRRLSRSAPPTAPPSTLRQASAAPIRTTAQPATDRWTAETQPAARRHQLPSPQPPPPAARGTKRKASATFAEVPVGAPGYAKKRATTTGSEAPGPLAVVKASQPAVPPAFPLPIAASAKAPLGSKLRGPAHRQNVGRFMAARPVPSGLAHHVETVAVIETFMVGEESLRETRVTEPTGRRVTVCQFDVSRSKMTQTFAPVVPMPMLLEGEGGAAARGMVPSGGEARRRRAFLYFFMDKDVTVDKGKKKVRVAEEFKNEVQVALGYHKQENVCNKTFGPFPMYDVTTDMLPLPKNDLRHLPFKIRVTTSNKIQGKMMASLLVFDMLTLDERVAKVYEETARFMGLAKLSAKHYGLTVIPTIPRDIPELRRRLLSFIRSHPAFPSGSLSKALADLRGGSPCRGGVSAARGVATPRTAGVARAIANGELEVGESEVSFKCPVSATRMVHPARGRNCRHTECFDVKVFLEMKKQPEATWKCPICNSVLVPDDVFIDPFFLRLLDAYPGATKCRILPTGDHAPASESAPANKAITMGVIDVDVGGGRRGAMEVIEVD
ncbi:hypothetical protein HDU96_002562 [Phlyctochytrium bullatum]|nr:hypothetical protein HDU96_002562 [Phlyctochytrium bullatum]